MRQKNRDAITFLAAHPAAVGRLCGFTRLTDALHAAPEMNGTARILEMIEEVQRKKERK